MRARRLRRLSLAAAAALALGGCAARLTPPSAVADPVSVAVLDHGRHAGLLLPRTAGGYTEWFWGDWRYYALGERSLGRGIDALIASDGATLGRRDFATWPSHADSGAVEEVVLTVERARAATLAADLERRFAAGAAAEVRHADGRRFVPDGSGYGLANTSAHRVADWLRALGVRVDGAGPTARFVVDRPRS